MTICNNLLTVKLVGLTKSHKIGHRHLFKDIVESSLLLIAGYSSLCVNKYLLTTWIYEAISCQGTTILKIPLVLLIVLVGENRKKYITDTQDITLSASRTIERPDFCVLWLVNNNVNRTLTEQYY